MVNVVVTGFDPFGEVTLNPSQRIIEALNADTMPGIFAAVLPTTFTEAGQRIEALLLEHRPAYLLMLGVSARRSTIGLERFALNINDAVIPDNEGRLATGQPIRANGPAAYRSTLPFDALYEAALPSGAPLEFSNYAGAYVCNHTFYSARDAVERHQLATACGFVHVPMMSDAEGQPGADIGLPFVTMLAAVRAMVGYLSQAVSD